jgi:hypothetical protein
VEDVIGVVFARLNVLLQRPMVKRERYADKYGGDSAFMCATLAINMTASSKLRLAVVNQIVQPMLAELRRKPTLRTNMAIMLTNTLLLLGDRTTIITDCVPLVAMSDLDHETFELFKTPDGFSYGDLVVGVVTTYFQSWALLSVPELMEKWRAVSPSAEFVAPEIIVSQAMDITYSRWYDMVIPLRFKPNKVLQQADDNRGKLYFLTHVLFMGNHYGTRPLDSRTFSHEEQQELHVIFSGWFGQFIDNDAIMQNLEEFCEVSYSLLFLSNGLGYKTEIPVKLTEVAAHLLQTAGKLSNVNSRNRTWYPRGRKYVEYTDGHTLLVAASLLVELVELARHDHD